MASGPYQALVDAGLAPRRPSPVGGSLFKAGATTPGYTWRSGQWGADTGTTPSVQGAPPFDWQGLREWDERTGEYFDQGVGALQSFSPAGSEFAQLLMRLFSSGQGIPPELLAQMKAQAAETEAGSRENALMRSRGSAHASGFGKSAAANYAQDQVRGQSAADLQRNITEMDVQNALMGLQRQGMAGGLLSNLYGQQAGIQSQLANMYANRSAPIYSAGQGPGASGEPVDPFVPGYLRDREGQGTYTPWSL